MNGQPRLLVADDPGPVRRGRIDWWWVAEQVRAHAPSWVCVGQFAPGISTRVKRGEYAALPEGEFEVTTRQVPGTKRKRYFLWLRHLADAAPAPALPTDGNRSSE